MLQQQAELGTLERTAGGIQHRQRAIAALRKQIDQQTAKLQQVSCSVPRSKLQQVSSSA